MFRLLVVITTLVCAFHCTSANAQGRSGKGYRGKGSKMRNYRSYRPVSPLGFSIGIGSYRGYGYSGFGYLDPYRFDGYGYDPYRYGSFRAPDLLNDPYFKERYRYDSRYPGRYRAPLVLRPAVPPATYQPHGRAMAYGDADAAQMIPADRADVASQLRSACQQLSHSLSILQDGNVWMEYLAPHRINPLIASGNSTELRELLTHYDGVVGNPQLRLIAAARGFGTTRSLLRQYVSPPSESTEPASADSR